jgi:hypothetical protein
VVSLLDSGPHTVRVYPEEKVLDSRGNHVRRASSTPVVVTGCIMQPMASTRGAFPAIDVKQGQRVDAAYRLIARTAPLGWWSRVEWDTPTGTVTMTVLGGPLMHRSSDGTMHVSATLQEER